MGICQCIFNRCGLPLTGWWSDSGRRVVPLNVDGKPSTKSDEAKLGSYIIVNTTDTNTYCIQLIERLPSIRQIRIHNRTTGKRETLLSHLVLEALNYQPSFDRERVIFALLNRNDCDLVPSPPTGNLGSDRQSPSVWGGTHTQASPPLLNLDKSPAVGSEVRITFGRNATGEYDRTTSDLSTVDAYSSPFFRVLLRLSNTNQRGTVVDIHRARIFFTRLLERMFDHPTVKEYVYYLMGFTNKTIHSQSHSQSVNRYRYNYYRHAIEQPPTIAGEHFRMLIYAESIHPWIRGRIDSILKELSNDSNPSNAVTTSCDTPVKTSAVYENPTYIHPNYVQSIPLGTSLTNDSKPVRATLYSPI
jgi:hypothetical protein